MVLKLLEEKCEPSFIKTKLEKILDEDTDNFLV